MFTRFSICDNILVAATVLKQDSGGGKLGSLVRNLPDFSTHAREEEEPCIQNHVRDVGTYTRYRKRGGS